MVDLSKIQPGIPININNQLYCFDKPIICVDTFTQLISQLSHYSANTTIVAVIPNGADNTGELSQLVSNYIVNNLHATPTTNKMMTTHTLDNLSAQEITSLSRGDTELETIWYLTHKYATYAAELQSLDNEMAVLTRKRDANTASDEEMARGYYLYNTLLPKIREMQDRAFAELTEAQKTFTQLIVEKQASMSTQKTEPVTVQNMEIEPTSPVENTSAAPVSEQADAITPEPVSTDTPANNATAPINLVTRKWRLPRYCSMSLLEARTLLEQSPYYQHYKTHQRQTIAGYTLVPPEYLLMFGIRVYPQDLPIVFTPSGEFMRLGESDHSKFDRDYWFPHPKRYHGI